MTTLLLALITQPAQAFCGTYVGHAGVELFNHASQVVVVRQRDRTTLTLANDYDGGATDFALIIPVPTVLRERDVRTVSPDLLASVENYSSPRLVEYTCDDLGMAVFDTAYASSAACGGGPAPEAPTEVADGVWVESSFQAGEYDIAVLSAEESEGLFGWLDSNGFSPHPDAEALLAEYIDADMRFLTAKVRVDSGGRKRLSPLQLSYDADSFALPIRIGTASSPGTQDLVLYTLTDASVGRVAIANYPERDLEDECMAPIDADTLGPYYAARLDELFADDGAAWTTEYSWSPQKCDPCVGEPLDDTTMRGLGWQGPTADAHFTRLHARYDKEAATEDLLLYGTGFRDTSQVRFIRHVPELESYYPVCGLGMVDEPGSCPDVDEEYRRRATLHPLWLGGVLVIAFAAGRRRDEEALLGRSDTHV